MTKKKHAERWWQIFNELKVRRQCLLSYFQQQVTNLFFLIFHKNVIKMTCVVGNFGSWNYHWRHTTSLAVNFFACFCLKYFFYFFRWHVPHVIRIFFIIIWNLMAKISLMCLPNDDKILKNFDEFYNWKFTSCILWHLLVASMGV